MENIFRLLLICISISCSLCQAPAGRVPIDSASWFSTSDNIYETVIDPECITSTAQIRRRPSGQSMENFIALIERLELRLANDTDQNLRQHAGAENVARLLLRRFRLDGYDSSQYPKPIKQRDVMFDEMNNAFFQKTVDNPNTYYFPDDWFTVDERCSLFYSLSHNIINTNDTARSYAPVFRGKRQSPYNNQQNQYNNQRNSPYNNRQNAPAQSDLPVQGRPLVTTRTSTYPIKEQGVVSFRGSKYEAIAPARVLIGIIAGLSSTLRTNAKDVLSALTPSAQLGSGYDKPFNDPVMTVTIADLWGASTARPNDDKTYFFGVTGEWGSTFTMNYYLTSIQSSQYSAAVNSNRGTRAEIRGGIDGYLIGRNLRSMSITEPQKLRLSTILRSYYSKPRITKSSTLSASYCDRNTQINAQELQTAAQHYYAIQATAKGLKLPADLIQEFTGHLSSAQQIETNGFSDYCNRPGGVLDKTAPCETPSDVIFVIDGSTGDKLTTSAEIVTRISGNLNNIRTEGGTVSIFFNSQGTNPDVHLPAGPGSWPLNVAAFNSTNTGASICRINDFNTTLPQPVANIGKYFQYLNTTLFNFEWWNPRTNASAVPAKAAVLIDLDTVPAAPDSGQDRNDYNYYKQQLRSRHRDVQFLSLATKKELFQDILRDLNTDWQNPTQFLAPALAKRICENPATFQYNLCHQRRSDGVEYVGYVTPGYKQNWAMYPEFFLKSFNIKFTFKAEDGDIKVCFDRYFPPEKQDEWYCKELKTGETKEFDISNPCNKESFDSCRPFYFTVWGKDRTANTQCLDERCASLDQIKWSVTHSGVQCSSSHHLLPSITFQFISLSIFAILYLFLTNKQ